MSFACKPETKRSDMLASMPTSTCRTESAKSVSLSTSDALMAEAEKASGALSSAPLITLLRTLAWATSVS